MSDDDLRQRFQALRHDDEQSTPSLQHTLVRPSAPEPEAPGWRWAAPLAVAAGVLAFALLFPPGEPGPPPAAFEPGQWVMPTDVLLELPGQDLLRDVPSLGTPPLPLAPPASRQSGVLRRTLA